MVMMLKRPEGFIPSKRRAQELHSEEMAQDAWLEIYGEKGLPEKVSEEPV
jgi:branched-chain amino acid transport system permease protein